MAQTIGLRARLDLSQFNTQVRSFITSVNQLQNEVTKTTRATSTEVDRSRGFLDRFGLSWSRIIDIVTGVTIIDIFRTVRRAVSDVANEALNATAAFQNLTIQLEAILARDFAKNFGGTAADALTQVTGQAQELLGWIREIAVSTPFSVETLASALAYGQAFGFNVGQTKRLTLATGNFVAGMGLTNEHMERIIYNFGQMLASGRVLGREVRDLANNFVPVHDVFELLAEQMGENIDTIKEWQKEGRLSAAQFISAFVEIAEQDFPNAMQRMSRTIQGVRQNIADFIHTLLGLELLGPVMGEIATNLADLLDRAFSPETIRFFTILGETLLQAFQDVRDAIGANLFFIGEFFKALGLGAPTAFSIASAILYFAETIRVLADSFSVGLSRVTGFINQISERFGTTFGELIQNARGWGYNIIISLANGMAAAISFVIQAITFVANAIASLLRAFSPPKILPDLPLWGKAAMQSWLEGWKLADFSLFDDIANLVERFLRSIPSGIGGEDNEGLIPAILGSRRVIAQAISQVRDGIISINEAIGRVTATTRGLNQQFRDYIRALFQVEAAQVAVEKAADRVEKAQNRLNQIQDKYTKILDELQRQLRGVTEEFDEQERLADIQEAINTGLLTNEELARLEAEKRAIQIRQQIRATEDQRDAEVSVAEAQLETARAAEEAAQAQLEASREQLATAKAAIEFQIKNNELLQEQLKLLERLAKQGKEEEEPLEFEFAAGFEEFESALAESKEAIRRAVEDLRIDILLRLNRLVDEIAAPFVALGDKLAPLIATINNIFNTIKTSPALQTLADAISNFADSVGIAFQNLQTFWEENGDEIIAIIQSFFSRLAEEFRPDVQKLIDNVAGFIEGLGETIVRLSEELIENGPQIQARLQEWVDWVFEEGIPKLRDFVATVRDEFLPVFSEIISRVSPAFPVILGIVGAFAGLVGLGKLLAPFLGFLFKFLIVANLIAGLPGVTAIISGIGTAIGGIATVIGSIGLGPLVALVAIIAALVTNFMGFRDVVIGALSAVKKTVTPAIEALRDAFEDLAPTLKFLRKQLEPVFAVLKFLGIFIGTVLVAAIAGTFTVLLAIITGFFTGFANGITLALEFAQKFYQGVVVAFDGVKNFIQGILKVIVGVFTLNSDLILQGLGQTFEGIKEIIIGTLYAIAGFVGSIFGFIIGLVEGFVKGVIDFFKNLAKSLVGGSIVPDMLNDMLTVFSTKLGEILSAVGQWITDVIRSILDRAGEFLASGEEIIANLRDGIVNLFVRSGGVLSTMVSKMTDLLAKVSDRYQEMKDKAIELFQNFVQGMIDKFIGEGGVIPTLVEKMQDAVDTVAEFISDFAQLGSEIISGIIEGISSNAHRLLNAISNIINRALGRAEDESGAQSPAKNWKPLGSAFLQGIEQGALERFSTTKQKLSAMMSELSNIPLESPGIGISADQLNRLYSRGSFGSNFAALPSMSSTFNRNVNVNVDAHYSSVQSEAGVYYDVRAALAHTSR